MALVLRLSGNLEGSRHSRPSLSRLSARGLDLPRLVILTGALVLVLFMIGLLLVSLQRPPPYELDPLAYDDRDAMAAPSESYPDGGRE